MKKKHWLMGSRGVALILVLTMVLTMIPVQGLQAKEKVETSAVTLKNPRIVPDSSMAAGQKVTWDCVWFGSYPQSEVTSSDAVYSKLQSATGWNSNNDVTVDGVKYRRMKEGDATYSISGRSDYYDWADSTTYHYFKYEPIKWRVLNVVNGQAMLLADVALDDQRYNASCSSITWEKSTMRSWLNGYSSGTNKDEIDYSSKNFIDSAFSVTAQNAIIQSNVVNDDNLYYGTEGGNNTSDKVFLLSEFEVYHTDRAKSYGFDTDYVTYDEARRSKYSIYAYAMGIWRNNYTTYKDNCCWWLRSPGYYADSATYVSVYGDVYRGGGSLNCDNHGVRPALNLNLSSSNLYTYAGTVSSDGTKNEEGSGSDVGGGDSGGNSGEEDYSETALPKSFSLEEKVVAEENEEITIKGTVVFQTSTSYNNIDNTIESIEWTSSDPSIAEVSNCSHLPSLLTNYTNLTVSVTPHYGGTVTITGKTKNGLTASCELTIKAPKKIPVASDNADEIADAIDFDASKYLSDIMLDDASIESPIIEIFDKKISLFDFKSSVKIETKKWKTEVSYDPSDKTVKVLIGFDNSGNAELVSENNKMNNKKWSEEYKSIKSLYKQMTGKEAQKSNRNGSYWNQFQKLKGQLNKLNCNMVISADMYVAGYAEWSYETGKLIFSEGGVIESAELGAEFKKRIPEFPLCYVLMGLKAAEKGSITATVKDGKWDWDFSLKPELIAKLGVGMGVTDGKYKSYLEGSLDASLSATISNGDTPLTVNMCGNVYLNGYLVGHELFNKAIPYVNAQLYPKESVSTLSLTKGKTLKEIYAEAKPLSRDYLNAVKTMSTADADTVKEATFPYSDPELFTLSNGRKLLIWVDDTGKKSAANKTSLCYSLYNGSSWSSVKTIAEDGCYFDAPSAYQEGDTIYLTYQKTNKQMTSGAGVEETLKALDLYLVTFDGNTFSEPTRLTSDNEVMEGGQILTAKDGDLILLWMENSENDIFLSSGTNTLYQKTYSNGTWSEKKALVSTTDTLAESAVGTLKDKTQTFYVLTTTDKSTLYNASTNTVIDTDIEGISELSIIDGNLYYLKGKELYSYNGTNTTSCGISGISNYQLFTHGLTTTLLTNASEGVSSNLYISEKKDGSWSALRPFSEEDNYIRNYSAVMEEDGSLSVAVNNLACTKETQTTGVYGDASLSIIKDCDYFDLSTDYLYYDQNNLIAGKELPLDFSVTNNSEKTVKQIKAVLNDKEGNVLLEKTISCEINAHETKEFTINYRLPSTLSQSEILLTVTTENKEKDMENNIASITLGQVDLQVSKVETKVKANGSVAVSGILENTGHTTATEVSLTTYDTGLTGDILKTISYDTINPGEKKEFSYIISADTYAKVENGDYRGIVLYAEAKEEEYVLANNEQKVTFVIERKEIPLSDCEISLAYDSIVYTGKEQQPEVTVSYNEEFLEAKNNYTVAYTENINVGTASVTVTGKENCIGTVTKTFEITKATYDLSNILFKDQTVTYDGKSHSLAISGDLPEGVSVSYENNDKIQAGTYEVIAKFAGDSNHKDIPDKKAKLMISEPAKNIALSDCEISLAYDSIVYTGKEQQPEVTVSYNGECLKADNNYMVHYAENINAGTASVTVTGRENYIGTVTKTFTITKATPTLTFAKSSLTKTYGNADFTNTLTKKTDGKITYQSSNTSIATVNSSTGKVRIKKAGKVTITVTASEGVNYKAGSKSYALTINNPANKITTSASSYTRTTSSKSQAFYLNLKRLGSARLHLNSSSRYVTVNTSGKVTIAKNYIGKATITITADATSKYSKTTKQVTVTVNPVKMSISSLKSPSRGAIQVSWKKDSRVTGYQIRYSTKSNMSGAKSTTIKGLSSLSKKITGLSKGKKYYVQLRAYKINGKTYYGAWSSIKKITTKK